MTDTNTDNDLADLISAETTGEQRARYDPTEATDADVEQALEGLPLFNMRRNQMIDFECRRCRQKNQKRRYADVAQRDNKNIVDGDPVTIHADHYTDTVLNEQYWRVTHLDHRGHPYKSLTEHAVADMHIVRAHATIQVVDAKDVRADRSGHDAVVTDVSIQERSKKGEGKLRDPPSDVERPGRTDPPSDWPDETVEWFDQLKAEHDIAEPSHRIESGERLL